MEVELIHPVAIENGTKFSIREGGRTVGAGSVASIENNFLKMIFKTIQFWIVFFVKILN